MRQENNKMKDPKACNQSWLKHTFPASQKCQCDSLCSESSSFTKHQFPLIIRLFILRLMMQPGLENSYDPCCSSRMTGTRTVNLSLPSFSFTGVYDFHPSTNRVFEQCPHPPTISSTPSLSYNHTQHHQFPMNKLVFLFCAPSTVTLVTAECSVGSSLLGGSSSLMSSVSGTL